MADLSDLGLIEDTKTNTDVTNEDVPDPSPLPRVGGDYLLIRPVSTFSDNIVTDSGVKLYIPTAVEEDVKYLHNVGRILAFGPRCFKTKEGKTIDWFEGGLKIGDIVQWERFVGKRMRYKGVNLVLVKANALNLTVEDQEDLDSLTSIEG